MSGAVDFVVAARNAGRDVLNDQARASAAKRAGELTVDASTSADNGVIYLCLAIKDALKALPHLPAGSRAPAGEALKKLALALDIAARVFTIARDDPHTDNSPRGDGDARNDRATETANPSSGAGAGADGRAGAASSSEEKPPYWVDAKQHE